MYGRSVQRIFLLIPVLYLFSLSGIAFYRSSVRKSVITSQALVASNSEGGEDEGEGLLSKLQLQDFHRVEIKDGKPLWEIKAKDAKYFPLELLS